ncbi:MAG: Ig-like domain repeat protein [Candidatus Omnitrophica bacterium]|nr:Ig-like domain repeat protein [Candidatus Omnitrophota bacterium]
MITSITFFISREAIAAPMVTITSPTADTTVSNNGFYFKGIADDTFGIEIIQVYINDTKQGWTVCNKSATYNKETKEWKFFVSPECITPERQATALIRAKNKKGVWSGWINRRVTVERDQSIDRTPPTVMINIPYAHEVVSYEGFTFSGTAHDPSGVSDVRIYICDLRKGWTVCNRKADYNINTNTWSYSVLQEHITPGKEVTVWVRAKDAVGNWSLWQHRKVATEPDPDIDITPPTVVITAPENNSAVFQTGFEFTGTINDASAIQEIRIYVYDHKKGWTVRNEKADYDVDIKTWNYFVSEEKVTVGRKATIWVRAKDYAGNWSLWQLRVANVIASGPQTPQFTAFPNNRYNEYTLYWTDIVMSGATIQYEIWEDGTADFSAPTIYNTNRPYYTFTERTKPGSYFYKVKAHSQYNAGGEKHESGFSDSVEVVVPDLPPEIETLDSQVDDDDDEDYEVNEVIRIAIKEKYNAADINSATIHITSDSAQYDSGEITLLRASDGHWVYHWETGYLKPATDFVIEATLSDASGQTASKTLAVSLASTPPLIGSLIKETDIFWLSNGFDFSFSRAYDITDTTSESPLGWGWRHSYDIFLHSNEDASIFVYDGHRGKVFYEYYNGTYRAPPWDHSSLKKNTDGTFTLIKKHGTVYCFGDNNKITSIADRNGNQMTFTYNGSDYLESVTTASEETFSFTYALVNDNKYRLERIYDPQGLYWEYEYDYGTGDLVEVINPLSERVSYLYDNHRITEIQDAEGGKRFFTYYEDAPERLKSIGEADHLNEKTYVYDSESLTVTDSRGRETKSVYTNNGKDVEIINAEGSSKILRFDESKNLIYYEDEEGAWNRFAYDDSGNQLSISDSRGKTQYTYDTAFYLLTSITDKRYHTTAFIRDTDNGNILQRVTPNGVITSHTYDEQGNLKTITDGLGYVTEYSYNFQGLVTTITRYDEDGSALKRTFTYTPRGKLESVTDENGHTVSYGYDILGRLTHSTNPSGYGVAYEYDKRGNLLVMRDALGREVAYAYDTQGRCISITYPDLSHEDFSYDEMGNMINYNDRIGRTTDIEYDLLDRPVVKLFADGSQKTVTYDKTGRLHTATNEAGTVSFAYNHLRQRINTTDVFGKTIQYAYDYTDNCIRLTDSYGEEIRYFYDEMNRLTDIYDQEDRHTHYNYDELSRVTEKTLPNGAMTTVAYDTISRAVSFVNETHHSWNISTFNYAYDDRGNIIEKERDGALEYYSYGDRNQLTEVNAPGKTSLYSFDNIGNREKVTHNSVLTHYTINELNQYTQVDDTRFQYDGNGCLIESSTPEGTTHFTYDYENRLITVKKPTGEEIRFAYDALGRRVSKQVVVAGEITSTVHYGYSGNRILTELDENLEQAATYVYGRGIDEVISRTDKNGDTIFYHTDYLGSVTEITNENEDIIESFDYDEYGNFRSEPAEKDTTYFFTGRRYDFETGLYYYRNRYYNPKLGRFLTPDPARFVDGPNMYTYVANNPVNYVDPLGLWWYEGGPFKSYAAYQEYLRKHRIVVITGPNGGLATADWCKFAGWLPRIGLFDDGESWPMWLAGPAGGSADPPGYSRETAKSMSPDGVLIGRKGIHGYVDVGGKTYGYGPRGIQSPDNYCNKGGSPARYYPTNANAGNTLGNIESMQNSGDWGREDYNVWNPFNYTHHNCWDAVFEETSSSNNG